MSDEDPTQKMPGTVSDTEPTMFTVMERLNSMQEIADKRHAELQEWITSGFRKLADKIEILNRSRLESEADYFSLLHRIEELESKAS